MLEYFGCELTFFLLSKYQIEESIKNDTFKDILKADYRSLEEIMERYLRDVIPLKKCVANEKYRHKLVTEPFIFFLRDA